MQRKEKKEKKSLGKGLPIPPYFELPRVYPGQPVKGENKSSVLFPRLFQLYLGTKVEYSSLYSNQT